MGISTLPQPRKEISLLKTENLLLTAGDVKIAAAGETPTVTIVADSGVDLTVPQIISWSIMTAR